MSYPNWKRGLKWGGVAGTVAAALWLGSALLLSVLEAPTDVALSRGYWALWMHGPVVAFCFCFVGCWTTLLVALRPEFPRKKSD